MVKHAGFHKEAVEVFLGLARLAPLFEDCYDPASPADPLADQLLIAHPRLNRPHFLCENPSAKRRGPSARVIRSHRHACSAASPAPAKIIGSAVSRNSNPKV